MLKARGIAYTRENRLGFHVLKVEAHGMGDTLRLPNFQRGGLTSFFVNANRNKRSMVLDLQQE